MSTRLLNKSDVTGLINIEKLVTEMKAGFCAHSEHSDISGNRFFSSLPGPGDMMLLAPGIGRDIPAYSVKVHAKFPEQDPGIRGVLLLNDLQTGALLAAMDSTYLTAVRTGLSAAIATDTLARKNASRVAVIGAGVQGRFQLRYLKELRSIENVLVYDISDASASAFIAQMQDELNIPINSADSISHAVSASDIVLCATWSTTPIIHFDMVNPGTHITTLGADQPNEAEIAAELIEASLFVCDDRKLAVSMGAIGGIGLNANHIDAELGEVLSENKSGRTDELQITIYGAVGVPFQDLVTAWHVFESARQHSVGLTFDFSA